MLKHMRGSQEDSFASLFTCYYNLEKHNHKRVTYINTYDDDDLFEFIFISIGCTVHLFYIFSNMGIL